MWHVWHLFYFILFYFFVSLCSSLFICFSRSVTCVCAVSISFSCKNDFSIIGHWIVSTLFTQINKKKKKFSCIFSTLFFLYRRELTIETDWVIVKCTCLVVINVLKISVYCHRCQQDFCLPTAKVKQQKKTSSLLSLTSQCINLLTCHKCSCTNRINFMIVMYDHKR